MCRTTTLEHYMLEKRQCKVHRWDDMKYLAKSVALTIPESLAIGGTAWEPHSHTNHSNGLCGIKSMTTLRTHSVRHTCKSFLAGKLE
jgi:hypothetical protein